jgi:hypothetical protein
MHCSNFRKFTRTRRARTVLLSSIVLLLCFFINMTAEPASAFKKITRHCSAEYQISPVRVDGEEVSSSNILSLGQFRGWGGCGPTVPSRCRRRARNRIRSCIDAHWNDFERFRTPMECTEQNHVKEYNISNLRSAIQERACNFYPGRTVQVDVRARIHGDISCGPGESKSELRQLGNVQFQCT